MALSGIIIGSPHGRVLQVSLSSEPVGSLCEVHGVLSSRDLSSISGGNLFRDSLGQP